MKTIFPRAPLWLRAVWVALLCCPSPVAADPAAADDDVLWVLDFGSGAQAGFLSALRIQLGGAYRVKVSAVDVPQSLPERLAFATELVESEHAFATVWMEEASSAPQHPRSAVLYVVGRRAGRALLEVVQAPGRRGLDLERMLSIKLSELLAELRAGQAHPLRPNVAAAPPAVEPPSASRQPPKPTPASPPTHGRAAVKRPLWGVFRVGPRFDVGVGSGWSRFGVAGAVAPELSWDSARLGVGLGLAAYPSLTVRDQGAEVRLSEVVPRVLATLSWARPDFSLGVQTGPQWSFLSVRGQTPLGRTRDDSAGVFGWTFGIAAEHELWSGLGIGAVVELQSAAERLHFDVNGTSVLDRGWLQVTVGVDVRLRHALFAATAGER